MSETELTEQKLSAVLGLTVPSTKLSEPELALLERLDLFAKTELEAQALQNDDLGRYPTDSIADLKKTGVLAAPVPAEFGGMGASHLFSLEVQMRLAKVDSSVAQIYKVHDELVREIFVYCPDFQRTRLADFIVKQQHIIGLAVAEAGRTAVDPLKTSATPAEDGGYVIDGFKIYTSGAAEADHIATWGFNPAAATEENPVLGMQLVLIPRDTEGVDVKRDWNALGQRATDSGSIQFSNVHCPPEWVASVSPGKAPLIHASLRYQAGFSACLCGMGFGALEAAVPYINERSRAWAQSGVQSASEDPMILRTIGELASDLGAAWAATVACADLLDSFERGEIGRGELAMPISIAKSASSRAAMAATGRVHELMGAGSISGKYDFDRYWRNARTLSLHDPVEWKNHELGKHLVTGWEPEPGVYQ